MREGPRNYGSVSTRTGSIRPGSVDAGGVRQAREPLRVGWQRAVDDEPYSSFSMMMVSTHLPSSSPCSL